MFSFITKVRTLKAVIASFNSITEELIFSIGPEEIQCKAMDPSRWSMVNIHWKKEDFIEYECNEPMLFGFRTEDMNNMIKRFKDDEVELSLKDEGRGKTLSMKSGVKEFELRLIPADMMPNIPDEIKGEFTCVIHETVQNLSSALDDVAIVSDTIEFNVDNGKLLFSGSGDASKMNSTLADKVEGTGGGTFNVDLFKGIIKSLDTLVEKCIISMGNRSPLRLNVFVTDKLIINYFLAPKLVEQK